MPNNFLKGLACAAIAAAMTIASASPSHAQTGIERKILLQQDLNIPGYETVLVAVTIAVGGREGRHPRCDAGRAGARRAAHAGTGRAAHAYL